jgi:deoxycytidylate deaminase
MTMKMTGRHKRMLSLAAAYAEKSPCDKSRHGALLVKGGSIINASWNINRYCNFGVRFRTDPGEACLHAEIKAVLGLPRATTEGATIYVARINKSGNMLLSKPCSMCEAALRFVGVKKAVYTCDEETCGIDKY